MGSGRGKQRRSRSQAPVFLADSFRPSSPSAGQPRVSPLSFESDIVARCPEIPRNFVQLTEPLVARSFSYPQREWQIGIFYDQQQKCLCLITAHGVVDGKWTSSLLKQKYHHRDDDGTGFSGVRLQAHRRLMEKKTKEYFVLSDREITASEISQALAGWELAAASQAMSVPGDELSAVTF
jgi:hypothetical protein